MPRSSSSSQVPKIPSEVTRSKEKLEAEAKAKAKAKDAKEKEKRPLPKEAAKADEKEKEKRRLPKIYRAPPEITSNVRKAYNPNAVCIGPYLSSRKNDPALKSMQDHKSACVEQLAETYRSSKNSLLTKMKKHVQRVRWSYSEKIFLADDELAEMMMLDGCFILDLLLLEEEPDRYVHEKHDDKVFGRLWIWDLVKCDLLLLENQIPFFVIQKLYETLKPTNDVPINLVEGALRYFSSLDPCRKGCSLKSFRAPPAHEVHHLLHLIHQSILLCPHLIKFRKSKNTNATIECDLERDSPQWIPGATELQAAGVKFKERKNASSFLDIKFSISKGVMEIPHLELHDYSDSLLRNLIAFEQTYPGQDFLVTAYAAFMDCLVGTKKNLKLLHQKGIVTFMMTGDMNTGFRLCNGVRYPADRNYLDGVIRDLTAYKDSKYHKWRADLRLKYFSSPWSIIVVVAATLTFLLTLIQAIFAVISYFGPSK